MPVPQTYQAFVDRIMPELHELTWESVRSYADATSGQFAWIPRVFNINATQRLRHEFSNQESVGPWTVGTELSPYPVVEWELPQDMQINLYPYKSSFLVSDMKMKYGGDPYIHVFPQLAEFTRNFVAGAMKAYNRRAGAIVMDVFAGAVQTVPFDGLPLASHTHHHQGDTATHYDNLSHYVLSAQALDNAFQLNSVSNLLDKNGDPLWINLDTLLIAPALRHTAFDLIQNTVLPGANNDQRNYWQGVVRNIIEIPWWLATNSMDTWWGLLDSSQHSLSGLVAEPPNITVDQGTTGPDQLQFYGRTIFEFFFKTWEGTVWSDGTIDFT